MVVTMDTGVVVDADVVIGTLDVVVIKDMGVLVDTDVVIGTLDVVVIPLRT